MPQIQHPFGTQATRLAEELLAVDQKILQQSTAQHYSMIIQKLSGEQPVIINNEEMYLRSRYSYAMFLDYPDARVMPYLTEQVLQWVKPDQVEIDPYTYTDAERSYTWQNLIVTIPGQTTPDEKILLTAHFDSIVVQGGDALKYAPGADDNATGTAVLLEAVRLFADESFEKTIEIIFFSGEEEGLNGSRAYLEDHSYDNIQAVINVDMIGFDSNNDHCMEIHAGTNPDSQIIGLVIQQVIIAYDIDLQSELLSNTATDRSDHASFWARNVPAITVIENFFDTATSDVCALPDPNPDYHQNEDTLANINITYAHDISQAILLTITQLAIPIE
ncbi:MAG: Zn-dependent exopeptidase M28 [Anaerolineaceae bacterium]|nr:Zn-dependent exopeptidase M28 [Anaerolineaceae bacterium]